ncbi:MAG: HD domain-containing phosphohydrolase, partial [Dehalococcoidia bacterium]
KLTDEEFKQMQQHTTYAYELLSHIPYLKHALDIPYCHHEKWDGSGYPRGLKGTDIPLSARIFSVVDVYDALISDRPYRKAWQEEKAIEYIKERSGKDFDPAVVQAFVKLAEEETDSLSSSEE